MLPSHAVAETSQKAELQLALDQLTLGNCQFLCTFLSWLYTGLALTHPLLLPPALAKTMIAFNVFTVISLQIIRRRADRICNINLAATCVTSLVFINALARLYLSREPKQATNIMLLLVGIGFLHLHPKWYLWNVIAVLSATLIVMSQFGMIPDNIHYGMAIIVATALSYFMHRSRHDNLCQIEALRIQSEQRRVHLESALTKAEKAQRSTETARYELQAALQAVKKVKETLEDRVRTRTAELERSNRELQDFASIASHDLQEPLRKIQVFATRLQDKYGPALGESGQDYVARMLSAGVRMQTLINDLLTFSRVTSKAKPFAEVDLNHIVRDVTADLEIRLEQTKGRIDKCELPTISADATQIRQLLQNLIGNALKFHKPDQAPVVTIRCHLQDQFCHLEIADNGIGFDEKYSEQIFAIFQRLHGRDEYEGTGIGLAVCRKIVERHDGTITAHSQLGQGTIFRIMLPCEHEEKSLAAQA